MPVSRSSAKKVRKQARRSAPAKEIGTDLPAGADRPFGTAIGAPLYRRVYDELKAEIANGTWKPGELLPTEAEISEKFGVSPGTVKQAMLGLAREGIVFRRAGKGTFVSRLDGSRSFARFLQFRHGSSGERLQPKIEVVGIRLRTDVPKGIRHELGLRSGEKVLQIRRRLVQGDVPICIYDSFLPHNMVPGLEKERLDVDRLYHAIEKKFDLRVVSVTEKLRAGAVSEADAALLDIPPRSPVIEIERVAYTHNNTVLEWRHTTGRSDHFVYTIQLP